MQSFLNFFSSGSYGLDVVSILVGLSFLYLGFHFTRAYDRAQEHDALILSLDPDQTWLLNSRLNARGFGQHLGKMGLASFDMDEPPFAKLYRAYFENLGAAGYRLFYHSDDFPEELARILSKNFADQCHGQALHEARHGSLKDYFINKVNVQDLYKINNRVVIAKIQVDAVIRQINSKKITDLWKLVDEDGKFKAEIDDFITLHHDVWTDYVVFGRTDNWRIYNIGKGTAYRSDDDVNLISVSALGDGLLKAVIEHKMDTGVSFDWDFVKMAVIISLIFAFGAWSIEHTPDAPVWLNAVCFISCMLGIVIGLSILVLHRSSIDKKSRK